MIKLQVFGVLKEYKLSIDQDKSLSDEQKVKFLEEKLMQILAGPRIQMSHNE